MNYRKHISIITLLAALSAGCNNKQQSANETAKNTAISKEQVTEIVGVGKVEPENGIVNLASADAGIVKEVYKTKGEKVKKGEAVLKLDDDLAQEKIQQTLTQTATQHTQVELEQRAIGELDYKITNKKALLERTEQLVKSGAETKQYLDDTRTELNVLLNNLEQKKLAVAVAKNKLAELERQLIIIKTEANKKMVSVPANGTLLSISAKVGEALSANQSYAEFAADGPVVVRAEIDELFADKVQIGQAAEIRYVGATTTLAHGRVSYLAAYLKKKSLFAEKTDDKEDRRVREITITLDNDANLLLNAKVECIIKR